MKAPKMNITAFVLFVLSGLLCAGSAGASVTYSYVGADYTSTYSSAYSTTEDVKLSFVVGSPLGTSFDGFVDPVSFTAFDGVMTISSSMYTTESFDIQTVAGIITNWDIYLTYNNTSTGGSNTIYTSTGLGATGFTDQGYIYDCPNESCEEAYAANNYSTPGTWTVTTSANVPEPATWAILPLGLAGLGFATHRRSGKVGAAPVRPAPCGQPRRRARRRGRLASVLGESARRAVRSPISG